MIKVSHFCFTIILFLGLLCSTPPKIYAMQCCLGLEGLAFSSKNLVKYSSFHTCQKFTRSHMPRRFYSSRHYNPQAPVYILSIDGGGIRGVIPARLLAHIEERLASKYSHPIRLASLFDIIAGTSTGGIIALGLSAPATFKNESEGYPAKILAELYRDHGSEIFPAKGPAFWQNLTSIITDKHDHQPLETHLDAYIKDLELEQAKTRVLIPAYEMNTNSTYVFDSYDATVPTKNYAMKDVARATSAAPTFFAAATIQNKNGDRRMFIDGGGWQSIIQLSLLLN